MALFGKKKEKEFCAICGKERKTGFLRGLFQASVDGQYVCSDCYGVVDIQSDILKDISIDAFKEYVNYRQANMALKEQFTPTSTVDFGLLDSKIVFDHTHGFLCFSKNLDKTIFEKNHLVSFRIREDSNVIFEGSSAGLRSYSSDVYNQLRLMQPRFTLFYQERRRFESHLRTLSSEERSEQQNNGPRFTYPEPFRNFYVEFNFQHPYWRQMTLDMSGPSFNESYNIEENYLTSYRLKFSTMEQLARDIMSFAFPNAGTVSAQTDIDSPQMDVVETLKRYKELVDMGVLTEEEFANKKRQLLGL